jgi:hypothetical protein
MSDTALSMPSGVHETIWQLFKTGPTWDGNLISKEARSWLVGNDLAFRTDGYNALTAAGVAMAVSLGMGTKKDKVPQ